MSIPSFYIDSSSIWLLIPCLLVSFAYAYILYKKEKDISKSLKKILFSLRFATVAFISLLLLGILLKTTQRTIEEPKIVILKDNSSSVILNSDSSFYKNTFNTQFSELEEKLGRKFDIQSFTFSSKLEDKGEPWTFTKSQTDIGEALSTVYDRYSNQNVGAIILVSDGLYNKGLDPKYTNKKLNAPIFTVALGDTTEKIDLKITNLEYNRITFKGNRFLIIPKIKAKGLKGKSAKLELFLKDSLLYSELIPINQNSLITQTQIELKAKEAGNYQYIAKITCFEEEITCKNNSAIAFIDVIEEKQKILILANSPHPDIAAIKSTLISNPNYEVVSKLIDDFSANDLDKCNLVILHQLPSSTSASKSALEALSKKEVPRYYIIGEQTNLKELNDQNIGIQINQKSKATDQSQASYTNNFYRFTLEESQLTNLQNLPPLNSPFGEYKTQANLSVLFNQKIGTVVSDKALFAVNASSAGKIGILTGTGIWKWKLFNYVNQGNSLDFKAFINKSVQYLCSDQRKDKFKVILNSKEFTPEDNILIRAELFDDTYQLINSPDINIQLTNTSGQEFNFAFGKTKQAYFLNAGQLPIGSYSYRAAIKLNNETISRSGSFIVKQLNIEELNTTADHRLLNSMSVNSGGKLYYPSEISAIEQDLLNNVNIKPVSYFELSTKELIRQKWLFFLILVLLTIEWFARKRAGIY
ncbi:MAG: hypothetical protein ACJAZ3_000092 [Sphingobacteriales bacterium]|jgi:hypothetical protein